MRTIEEQNKILDSYISTWRGYKYYGQTHKYYPDELTILRYYIDGGFDNRPCVVSDNSSWNVDTPENPNSILFILQGVVRTFSLKDLDLRNVEVSFALRAKGLNLYGANTYFWVVMQDPPASTRWHLISNPLKIVEGEWANQSVLLANDESKWHCSYSKLPRPFNLDTTLSGVTSFGFAFTDFAKPVTGQIGLSAFSFNRVFDSIVPL